MLTKKYMLSREWYRNLSNALTQKGSEASKETFSYFKNVFRADEFMLLHFKPDVKPDLLLQITDNPERQQQIQEYLDGFYLIDPLYLNIEDAARSGAINLGEVMAETMLHTSEYYRHHYHKTDFVDEFCYSLPIAESGYLLASFARSDRVGQYTETEIHLAKAITPILKAVIQNNWDANNISSPTSEDIKLHHVLQEARNNFGKSVLTAREFEVLQFMIRSYPIDLIAQRLDMALGTTKVHRRNIYRKLDINSRAELFSLFFDTLSLSKNGEDPLQSYCAE